MSFKSYGEVTIKSIQAISEIPPTVMIGLGGTGKEVLLRVRQLFFEKYGVPGFPTTKYLWIDTDIRDHNIDGKSMDYLADEVKFSAAEKIDCQINGEEFIELQKRRNENPHIFEWFDGRLARLGSVINGARQIRQLGRLAFWHHAFKNNDIRRKLGNAVEEIGSAANRNRLQDRFGINCTNDRRFILVFSVAGGTGSGMFLDMAFLIKREFGALNPDIIGYLVLPSVFSPDPHNAQPIYSNAYAALKELEYYSMRKDFSADPDKIAQLNTSAGGADTMVSAHDFNANWDNLGNNFIAGPPFNACYLIDNQTQAGGTITPEYKTDLCDMIAENIFLDYSNEGFSNKKRTVRSNLDDYLTRELEYEYKGNRTKDPIHTELFSRRFSAFGLNKIYVPIERVRNACTFKLITDILARITKINPPEADIEKTIKNNILPTLLLRVQSGNDDFLQNLQIANDSGSNFQQLIDNFWINTERPKLLQAVRNKDKGLANRYEAVMVGFRQDHLNESRDPHDWGHYIKRIKRTNKERFIKESKDRILVQVAKWLDNPHIRFDLAIDYLLEINRILAKHQEFFEKNMGRYRDQEKSFLDRVRSLQVLLGDEENGAWYHGWALHATVESITRLTAQHFRQAVLTVIFTTAAEICRELQDFIGTSFQEEKDGKVRVIRKGLVQRVWTLKEDLIDIKINFDRKLHSFEQAEAHQIFENLFLADQLPLFYHFQDSDGKKVEIDTEQLERMENQLRDHLEIRSIMDLIEMKESIGIGNIIHKIEAFGASRFRSVQFDVDAVITFFTKYSKNEKRLIDKIRHFVEYGKVWLRKGAGAAVTEGITKDYAEEVEIGSNQKMSEHDYHQQFNKLVREQVHAVGFKGNLSSGVDVSKDVAYFYDEYAGLPLMYIGNLKDYKDAYINEAIHGRTLHLDRRNEQFTDIMIKDPGEVQDIIDIMKVLFSGMILRVINVESDPESNIENYVYKDYNNLLPAPRPLGERQIAIEFLRNDRQLLEEIETKIERVYNSMSENLQIKYFIILYSYQVAADFAEGVPEGPFPPKYVSIAGRNVEKYTPEYRAIRALANRVGADLKVRKGWELKKMNDYFIDQMRTNEVNDFSEKVNVKGQTLLIFKRLDELQDLLNKA